jgi:hypothetical protein
MSNCLLCLRKTVTEINCSGIREIQIQPNQEEENFRGREYKHSLLLSSFNDPVSTALFQALCRTITGQQRICPMKEKVCILYFFGH